MTAEEAVQALIGDWIPEEIREKHIKRYRFRVYTKIKFLKDYDLFKMFLKNFEGCDPKYQDEFIRYRTHGVD